MKDLFLDPEPIANLRELERQTGRPLVGDVTSRFLDGLSAAIGRLRTSCVEGDFEALEAEAHALGGSAAVLGATALEERCRRAEIAARDGSLERLGVELDEIERIADSTADELRALARLAP